VRFDALYTLTNLPISRFLEWLVDSDNLADYMAQLVAAYNPAAAAGVMCRNTISVGWDGRLFDCDFNQMLELEVVASPGVDNAAPAGWAGIGDGVEAAALAGRDSGDGSGVFAVMYPPGSPGHCGSP